MYKIKANLVLLVLVWGMLFYGSYLFIIEGDFRLGFFFVPLILSPFFIHFNCIEVKNDEIIFYRIFRIPWDKIIHIKRVNARLYSVKASKFPYYLTLTSTEKFDELLKFTGNKIGKKML